MGLLRGGGGELSLKESLLEILDCCLNHEERVSDVERRCEDNYQHIRSLLYNGDDVLILL